jgi:hypothetical protein
MANFAKHLNDWVDGVSKSKQDWQWGLFKIGGKRLKKRFYKMPDPDYYPYIMLPKWLGYALFWIKEVK